MASTFSYLFIRKPASIQAGQNSHSPDIDLLNFRRKVCAEPCPHCARRSTLKAHGFLRGFDGQAAGVPRAQRFFLL